MLHWCVEIGVKVTVGECVVFLPEGSSSGVGVSMKKSQIARQRNPKKISNSSFVSSTAPLKVAFSLLSSLSSYFHAELFFYISLWSISQQHRKKWDFSSIHHHPSVECFFLSDVFFFALIQKRRKPNRINRNDAYRIISLIRVDVKKVLCLCFVFYLRRYVPQTLAPVRS